MFGRIVDDSEQENWSFPSGFSKYSQTKPKSRLGRRSTKSESVTHPVTPGPSFFPDKVAVLKDIANVIQETNPVLNDSFISDSSTSVTDTSRSTHLYESYKTPARSFYRPCTDESPLNPLRGILSPELNTLYLTPSSSVKNNVHKALFGRTAEGDRSFGITSLDDRTEPIDDNSLLFKGASNNYPNDKIDSEMKHYASHDYKESAPICSSSKEDNGMDKWRNSESVPICSSSKEDNGMDKWRKSESVPICSSSKEDSGTDKWKNSESDSNNHSHNVEPHSHPADSCKTSLSQDGRFYKPLDILSSNFTDAKLPLLSLKPIPGIDKITQNISAHFSRSTSLSNQHNKPLPHSTNSSENYFRINVEDKAEPKKTVDSFDHFKSTYNRLNDRASLLFPHNKPEQTVDEIDGFKSAGANQNNYNSLSTRFQNKFDKLLQSQKYENNYLDSQTPVNPFKKNHIQVSTELNGLSTGLSSSSHGVISHTSQSGRQFSNDNPFFEQKFGYNVETPKLPHNSHNSNNNLIRDDRLLETPVSSVPNSEEAKTFKNSFFKQPDRPFSNSSSSTSTPTCSSGSYSVGSFQPVGEINGHSKQEVSEGARQSIIFQASLLKNESSIIEETEVPSHGRSNIFCSSIFKPSPDEENRRGLSMNNRDHPLKLSLLPPSNFVKSPADSILKNDLMCKTGNVYSVNNRTQEHRNSHCHPQPVPRKEESMPRAVEQEQNVFKKPLNIVQRSSRQNCNLPEKLFIGGIAYPVLSLLGKGGSSKVYLAGDESQAFAIKCVDLSSVDQSIADGYLNEIKLLEVLQTCPSVIKMHTHEYKESTKKLFVVMEKGDVDFANLIKSHAKNKMMPLHMIVFYWMEMLTCVNAIHEKGVIHSDLKPANFLLVGGRLKLIDFGISSSLQEDMTSIVKDVTTGTFNYMSPEAVINHSATQRGHKISYKSDVWSLGCILYQLIYGRTPYSHVTQIWAKMQAIGDSKCLPTYSDVDISLGLQIAVRWCLNKDPKKRPTTSQLLSMPYFDLFPDTPWGAHIKSQLYAHIIEMFPDCTVNMPTAKN